MFRLKTLANLPLRHSNYLSFARCPINLPRYTFITFNDNNPDDNLKAKQSINTGSLLQEVLKQGGQQQEDISHLNAEQLSAYYVNLNDNEQGRRIIQQELLRFGLKPQRQFDQNRTNLMLHLTKGKALDKDQKAQASETPKPDSDQDTSYQPKGFWKADRVVKTQPTKYGGSHSRIQNPDFKNSVLSEQAEMKKDEEFVRTELTRLFSKKKRPNQAAEQDNQPVKNIVVKEPNNLPKYDPSVSLLKSLLQKRGPQLDAVQLTTGQSATSHQQYSENRIIDTIFGMNGHDLEKYFETYTTKEDSIFQNMNFSLTDFQQAQNLAKKRIMINMINFHDGCITNPNQIMDMQKPASQIFIGAKNWLSMNDKSKQMVKDVLQEYEDTAISEKFLQDSDFLVQIIAILNYTGKNKTSKLVGEMLQTYHKKTEQDYNKDLSIKKLLQNAQIINFLSQNSTNHNYINKIQMTFSLGIKKYITSKLLRTYQFYEKVELLKAMPQVTIPSSKSINYMILSDLMSYEKDNWELLNKDTVLMIVDKCNELSKYRELNNKLRSCLLNIKTHDYSLEDFHQLLKKLSEDKNNKIDTKIMQHLLARRNFKTFAYIPNKEELGKHIDFFEFIYNQNPLFYVNIPNEIKSLLTRVHQLAAQEPLNLKDMVKFSKIMIPSLYKPNFFFHDMLKNTEESFKTDVENQDLLQLVTEISKRVSEGVIAFEHLQMSHSKQHSNYKPYSEKTFLLLQRIMKDLMEDQQSITEKEQKVIFKILQNEQVVAKLFRDSEHAKEVLERAIQVRKGSLLQSEAEFKLATKDESLAYEFEMDWDFLKDTFKSMASIQPLIQDQPELIQKSQDLVHQCLDQVNQQILNAKSYELDPILDLNTAIISAIEQLPEIEKTYEQQSPMAEIAQVILEHHFLQLKTQMHRFVKYKKNIKVQRVIQMEVNSSLIIKHTGSFIKYLRVTSNSENHRELAKLLITQIKIGRSLVGENLLDLFKLVDKFGLLDHVRPLIMAVASNLQTIEKPGFYTNYGQNIDQGLQEAQIRRADLDKENKQMIFNKYRAIFNAEPHLVTSGEHSLSSLSYIMADLLPDFTDQEVITCLKMLGNKRFENFSDAFIKALYERYSDHHVIEMMSANNQKQFLEFAKHWPHFLKNNAIIQQLMASKGSRILVADQSESLSILADKNMYNPELMNNHFEMFIKMKDKDNVAKYMKTFLHVCAYLGHADFDIQKLTQVFRRIYKNPEQVELSQLLDYFTMLALSDTHFSEFDQKSVDFVTKCLDIIESSFVGLEQMEVEQVDPLTGEKEKFKVNYYNPIQTDSKIYNKVLIKGEQPKLNFQKALAEIAQTSSSESEEEEVAAAVKRSGKVIDQGTSSLSESEDELPSTKDPKDDTITLVEQELIAEESAAEPDFQNIDKQQSKLEELATKHGKKIFDFKARESLYSEELEFHQYRKKKLQDLDKKSKHLLLFSNINQLNFVDINENDMVRAWVILFHFRNKSRDSLIFEEFESIVMRNTKGKSKGHESFSKFYMELVDKSYDCQYKVNMCQQCEKTGWPLDISIQHLQKPQKKQALFFFLQEELCFNAKSQTEEPLALQKLMLQHLTNMSDYYVEFITENEFYANKDDREQFIDKVFRNKLGITIPQKSPTNEGFKRFRYAKE